MWNQYRTRLIAAALTISSLVGITACKENEFVQNHSSASARVGGPDFMFYALSDGNRLLQLNTSNPETILATVPVTNLLAGDALLAIDFRPATGQLYGVSSTSRLYTINPLTGVARMVGAGPFLNTPIDGVAFDFNPTVDRIRLVTNSGQNFRLNPETGTIAATDGNINGANGAVVTGAAYTNNRAGVTTTTLYVIDPISDKLYIQNPPNNGTLVEVGSLGVDAAGLSGFDISADGTSALASLGVNNRTELHQINLATGRAEKVGNMPNISIAGVAIPTEPVAYAADGYNNLLIFNPLNPGTPIVKAITGLAPGANIQGLDFRPANGQLYALGSNSQIYTIYTATGAATAVGTPFTPALSGADFGFDFNPTVDRIRVVSNTGQNLRLNPDNGTVAAVDGNINPAGALVSGSAYTNNFAGATTTVLYNLDYSTGQLLRQDPPNNGTVTSVGPLGVSFEGGNGFDITGTTNTAYALLRLSRLSNQPGQSKIYRINLTTGAATPVADFPNAVQAMTVGLGF